MPARGNLQFLAFADPTNPKLFQDQLLHLAESVVVENPYIVPDGLPRSIWEDKYTRVKDDKTFQTWEERLREVCAGNVSLTNKIKGQEINVGEYSELIRLASEGAICFSGRHLQHGDLDQVNKQLEYFSNCASAPFSFLTFLKGLKGSGVTSDYTARIRPVNWDLMPNIRVVLNGGDGDDGSDAESFEKGKYRTGAHPDFKLARTEFNGGFETLREARHKYPSDSEWVRWFEVEDSAEGWATCICALETAAYHEKHRDKLFIFEFTQVREAGVGIAGQQGRPSSGPLPLMRALLKIASIKGSYMQPWKQAMFIDDYAAQAIIIGGVRRTARMAVKWWEDRDIFDFIEIKRGGHLKMANNTILVDEKFWRERKDPRTHAYRVFHAACGAGYYDKTGEPGFATVTNMRQNRKGIEDINIDNYLDFEHCGMQIHPRTYDLVEKVLESCKKLPYICAPNPCFSKDTLIVTDKGAFPIKSLVGKTVNIWNGNSWETINTFRKTGANQPMLKIGLYDGSELRVTPYHTMKVEDDIGGINDIPAKDLNIGMKLQPSEATYNGNIREYGAYLKGFMLGDGELENGARPYLKLYPPKYDCEARLIDSAYELEVEAKTLILTLKTELAFELNSDMTSKHLEGLAACKTELNPWVSTYRESLPYEVFQWNHDSKCKFIAGYFDADGSAVDNQEFGYQATSINRSILAGVQILLKSIGVRSHLALGKKADIKAMPGGEYYCQPLWRLSIAQESSIKLAQQVRFSRLTSFANRSILNTRKSKAGKIVSIQNDGIDAEVFCCTVPSNHTISLSIGVSAGNCGEANLPTFGAECLVGDIGLSRVRSIDDAKRSAFLLAKCLVRVAGIMPGINKAENARSMRIGVSVIGFFEFFWNHFGLTFYDMISVHDFIFGKNNITTPNGMSIYSMPSVLNEKQTEAVRAWCVLRDIAEQAEIGAIEEADKFGFNHPDTTLVSKPGGTVAKVLAATESANPPSRSTYLRYIQFPKSVINDGVELPNPIVTEYSKCGYVIKDISHKYPGYVVVGFPTIQPYVLALREAGVPEDQIVKANKLSMEDNYKWLRLLEKFWLGSNPSDEGAPLNGQIAYTMKVNFNEVSFDQFMKAIAENQPTIRCCSYNPCVNDDQAREEADNLAEVYGYSPEYPIDWTEYTSLMANITPANKEAYNENEGACEGNFCALDGNVN